MKIKKENCKETYKWRNFYMKNRIVSLGLAVAVAFSCATPAFGMNFLRNLGATFAPNWIKQKYVEKQVGDMTKDVNSGIADFITNSGPLGQVALVAVGGLATFFIIQTVLAKKSTGNAVDNKNEPNILRTLLGLFASFYGEADTVKVFTDETNAGVKQVNDNLPRELQYVQQLYKVGQNINEDMERRRKEAEANKPTLEQQKQKLKELNQKLKEQERELKAKKADLAKQQITDAKRKEEKAKLDKELADVMKKLSDVQDQKVKLA